MAEARKAAKAAAPAEIPPTETTEQPTEQPAAVATPRGPCVVKDGTPHMGLATPGAKICSAHAMRYLADGTPRAKAHAAAQERAQQPGGGTLAGEGR